jgi:hypothetical protein
MTGIRDNTRENRMYKILVFIGLGILFVFMAGCGKDAEKKQENNESELTRTGIPEGIPIYPGAKSVVDFDNAPLLFPEEEFKLDVYETSAPITEVYAFYIKKLSEQGFEVTGEYDGGKEFMLGVTQAGESIAVVHADAEKYELGQEKIQPDRTLLLIWHSMN